MLLPDVYNPLIEQALREDVMGGGDITSEATVDADTMARAKAVARTSIVACGAKLFVATFARIDPDLRCEVCVSDGQRVSAGTVMWTVEGRARSILMGERVALNFVQRMSGIATQTRAYVDALVDAIGPGSGVRITDTRKTTPCLRAIERYAVRVGGGHNHRDCLASAVLIKDNHIVASGGIERAVARARAFAPHTCRIEVEVDNLVQLDEALRAGADVIMLDNFNDVDIARAVERVTKNTEIGLQKQAVLEVSGGVNLARIGAIARLGVDVISVGALTHSVAAADIGLDLELVNG